MAEENKQSGKGDGRNPRRRYFRRNKGGASGGSSGSGSGGSSNSESQQPAAAENKPRHPAPKRPDPKADGGNRNERRNRNRRNRRSRGRRGTGQDGRPEQVISRFDERSDYVAPTSVFIYTHVVRPSVRESYEIRTEHFSKTGRRLEDFEIDVAFLFKDEAARAEGKVVKQTVLSDIEMDEFYNYDDEPEGVESSVPDITVDFDSDL